MVENDKRNAFSTETGSLKFGSGSLEIINGEECWSVPGLGIYNRLGKYIGETIEEAKQTLESKKSDGEQNEK